MLDPNEAVRLAHDRIDFVMRLHQILALCSARASQVIDDATTAGILYAVSRFDPFTSFMGHVEEEPAEPLATAKAELETDIHILAGLLLAGAYSAVEDFVRELVVMRFRDDPAARRLPDVVRLATDKKKPKPLDAVSPESLYDALLKQACEPALNNDPCRGEIGVEN